MPDRGIRLIGHVIEIIGDLGRSPPLGDVEKIGEQVAEMLLSDEDTNAIFVIRDCLAGRRLLSFVATAFHRDRVARKFDWHASGVADVAALVVIERVMPVRRE